MKISAVQKIGSVISTLIIILLILGILLFAIPRFLLKADMRGVLTGSMEPVYSVGSLVVDVRTDFDDIQVGDDIVYQRSDSGLVVTHRVIAIDKEHRMITTQGTANSLADAPVSYSSVIGVIKFHVPLLGYALIWLSDLKGKIIAFTVIAALWFISVIISKLRDTDEEDEAEPGEEPQTAKKIYREAG